LHRYYHLAKEHGFRARSAFKLVQLNKKYNFLADAQCVIDLCAAPGGWLQVCAKYMPMGSTIIGVDLCDIRPIRNVVCIKEDITSQKCRSILKKVLILKFCPYFCLSALMWVGFQEVAGKKVDVVLHDGSPNMGTSWVNDAYGQSELTLCSLKLATEFLKPGGIFISKIFRSQDYTALLWVLNQLFKKVEATKPPASRNTSAEIYAVCSVFTVFITFISKYIALIRFFDFLRATWRRPKSIRVFWTRITSSIPQRPLRRPPNRPTCSCCRTNPLVSAAVSIYNDFLFFLFQIFSISFFVCRFAGYSDTDTSLLYKHATIYDFISHPHALDMLGSVHALTMTDEASKPYANHPATDAEIRTLCSDLKVLSKADFKGLLRWRLKMVAYREQLEASLGDAAADKTEKLSRPLLTAEQRAAKDEAIAESELSSLERELAMRARRTKKKEAERRAKLRERLQSGGTEMEAADEESHGEGLFALNQIRDSKSLDALEVDQDYLPDEEEWNRSSGDDGSDSEVEEREVNDDVYFTDSDEEARFRRLEDDLDHVYDAYKQRQNILTKADRKKKLGQLGLEGDEIVAPVDDDADDTQAIANLKAAAKPIKSKNPLLVELNENEPVESEQRKAQRWFSKDVFAGIEDQLMNDEFASGVMSKPRKGAAAAAVAAVAAPARAKAAAKPAAVQDVDMLDADDESEEDSVPAAKKSRVGKSATASKSQTTAEVEEMPLPNTKKEKSRKRRRRQTRKGGDADGKESSYHDAEDKKQSFEEVPVASDYSSDSDAVAEALAIGKQFLKKRNKEDIIDSAYNRACFLFNFFMPFFCTDSFLFLFSQAMLSRTMVSCPHGLSRTRRNTMSRSCR
jgi:AdoMet-dependent rRNA methyltransferase SPB1